MSRRVIALVLALVMIASSLLAFAPGATAHAMKPASARVSAATTPAVSSLTPRVLNGHDHSTGTFYPGETYSGTLFFSVTDSAAGDKSVNVTLTDPNATRDGVASPALSVEETLNTTATPHFYNSYVTNVNYTFSGAIPYNGLWTVNFSESASNYVDVVISVQVYSVDVYSSVGDGVTLPGQPLTVYWSLYSEANDATYTRATNVFITGTYDGNGTTQKLFTPANTPLSGAATGYGMWQGTIPGNAVPDTSLDIEVYAYTNVSGVTIQNESNTVDVAIGELTIWDWGLTLAPPTCSFTSGSPFGAGSTLAGCVQVGAYDGTFTPIAGLSLTLGFWDGTAHVTPAGAPNTLTSNASGEAAYTFVASAPPFVVSTHTTVDNAVNYTLTDPHAYAKGFAWTVYENETWVLVPPLTGFGYVNVTLDKSEYYVGGTATVTWSVQSSNASKTGALTPEGWWIRYGYDQYSAFTPLNASPLHGTFKVPVTAAMLSNGGYFEIELYAVNASHTFDGNAVASVLGPTLLLTASSDYYTAGSTVSVTPVLEGALSGTTIQYQVVGEWEHYGNTNLSAGVATNNTAISIPISSTDPPQRVYVDAWATYNGLAVAENETGLDLQYGYSIQLGVSTASSYSDGSFQPGQTITLQYAIVPVGGAPEPPLASFLLLAVGFPQLHFISNVGPSGTLSFTIPSDAVQGNLVIWLEAESDLGGPCFPLGICLGIAGIAINPHPSALSLELGAGSGVTVGWVIVLALVIVVGAVLAWMLLRHRGGRGKMGTSTSSGGSTNPPPEWKEPASGSGAPPAGGSPPNPPSGAS